MTGVRQTLNCVGAARGLGVQVTHFPPFTEEKTEARAGMFVITR